ncbi:MAG: hypothetical protein ACT7A5_15900 [Ferrovibrionaceae bacterium]
MLNAEPARRRAVWLAQQFVSLATGAASLQSQEQHTAAARLLGQIASDLGRASDANHGDNALAMTLWAIRGALIEHATRRPWRACTPGELAEMHGSIVGMAVAARAIEARRASRAQIPGGAA